VGCADVHGGAHERAVRIGVDPGMKAHEKRMKETRRIDRVSQRKIDENEDQMTKRMTE
jgi:hypothetical protein